MKTVAKPVPGVDARRLAALLKGRRKWWAAALLIAILSIGFGGSWLAALGALPFVISVLPCLAMCALGLCMQRMNGSSCHTTAQAQGPKEES